METEHFILDYYYRGDWRNECLVTLVWLRYAQRMQNDDEQLQPAVG